MPCSGLRTPARLSIRQWGLLSDGMLKADRRQARAEPDNLRAARPKPWIVQTGRFSGG